MPLVKYLLGQLGIILIISLLNAKYGSAQVGGVNACTNFTCRYGECEQFETDFQCHCIPGVKGRNCDRNLLTGEDLCLSSPCWGNGTCVNLGTDYRCTCPAGRTGKNCRTIESAPCITNNPCRNNAICRVTNPTDFYCFCVGYWTGRYCETPVGLCSRTTPCYNGGTCVNNMCKCPNNFTGSLCEQYRQVDLRKVIKVKNKGWYTAKLGLYYEQQIGATKQSMYQSGTIVSGSDYAFYVPETVNYQGSAGVNLVAEAVGGKRIMSIRINGSPECFHVYGTTLYPAYSYMPCW